MSILLTPLNDDLIISFSIIINHSNQGINLKDYAQDIIDGNITQTLSHHEFNNMFGPSQKDIDAVCIFAERFNLFVERVYTSSATISINGTVSNINQAFNIKLIGDIDCYSYLGTITIPENLENIVECVLGLDNTIKLTRDSIIIQTIADPTIPPYIPSTVANAYNFPVSTGVNECIGIIELGGGYTQQNLIDTFQLYNLPVPTVVDQILPGGRNYPDSDDSMEVMLDIGVAGGVAPGAKLAVYFAPNSFSGFVGAVNAAIGDKINAPSAISISWAAYERLWDNSNRLAMEKALQCAIVKGITVIAASGDTGSRVPSNNAKPPNLVFGVMYPSSSTNILSCGGTYLTLNKNGSIANEISWNDGNSGSGGGVSTIYTVPTYQTGLTSNAYPSGNVSTLTQRGVPDVSGDGAPETGYYFYYGPTSVRGSAGGTSAVSPLYAGLVARLNSVLGYKVGFLNKILYNNSTAFRDIRSSNNACPSWALPGYTPNGYNATPGWDACTGLGSPNGVNIMKAILGQLTPVIPSVVYPADEVGTRPSSGQTYPRTKISQIQ